MDTLNGTQRGRSNTDHDCTVTFRGTFEELHTSLVEAQQNRERRSELTADGTPEWVGYERTVMLDATTALLIRHQLPIDADEITRRVVEAEQDASGHSDYAQTWALGCAQYIHTLAAASGQGQ